MGGGGQKHTGKENTLDTKTHHDCIMIMGGDLCKKLASKQ